MERRRVDTASLEDDQVLGDLVQGEEKVGDAVRDVALHVDNREIRIRRTLPDGRPRTEFLANSLR
jgi:hypothetical protein